VAKVICDQAKTCDRGRDWPVCKHSKEHLDNGACSVTFGCAHNKNCICLLVKPNQWDK
jgi:hypothetical protein